MDLQTDDAQPLTCTFTSEQRNFRTTSPRNKRMRVPRAILAQRATQRTQCQVHRNMFSTLGEGCRSRRVLTRAPSCWSCVLQPLPGRGAVAEHPDSATGNLGFRCANDAWADWIADQV